MGFLDGIGKVFDPGGWFTGNPAMSSETQGTTSTQPWGGQQKYLLDIFNQAQGLSQTPLQYYPGQAIASFSPEQVKAQKLITSRATSGSPLLKSAQSQAYNIGQGSYLDRSPNFNYMNDALGGNYQYLQDALGGNFNYLQDALGGNFNYLQDTLNGQYLTPESNPYLSSYVQKAYEETLPQLDTSAIQAGRYGSEAWGAMKGRSMADIASNIYGQAYETERARQDAAQQYATGLQTSAQQYATGLQTSTQQHATDLQTSAQQYATGLQEQTYQDEANRMMQAIGLAPQLAEADYTDMAKLAAVGEEKQAMKQALLNEQRNSYEFQQMEPWERLGMYLNMITGEYGGSTNSLSQKEGK